MTAKQITTANNELLTALCENAGIQTELIPDVAGSIGGGGISRPKQ